MEVFMAQKVLWNLVGEKMLRDRGALHKEEGDARNKALQDRGALPREDGDAIREYRATH